MSDVFVVDWATAVGYLWDLLSEICANSSFLWRGSVLPLGVEAVLNPVIELCLIH